jgi:hypothetical protein
VNRVRQCTIVETAVVLAQVTCGFQLANIPLGFSFHTQRQMKLE